ncbi:hypothetical protein RBB50_002492 [Rhinocladiella similis]
MAVRSKSAIPLFIFLALLLLVLPCAAILWHGNRKFREQKKHRKSRQKTVQNIIQTMPTPVEMGKIRTPPVIVAPPRERVRERQLPLAWRGPDGRFIIPNQACQKGLSNISKRHPQGQGAKAVVEERELSIPSMPPTPKTAEEPLPPTQYAAFVEPPEIFLMPAPKKKETHARVHEIPQRKAGFALAPTVHSQYGIPDDDVEYDTQTQTNKVWA